MRDLERIERIRLLLKAQSYDALVCALPANVLLLSGYFPVIGTSIAIATREGAIALLVPEDELELAQRGWADELHTFQPSTLDKLTTAADEITQPLREMLGKLGLTDGVIGHEHDDSLQPATYSARYFYGNTLHIALRAALPLATVKEADDLLAQLRAIKSAGEIARIRIACQMAQSAFVAGAAAVKPGMLETEIAEMFRAFLRTPPETADVARAEGFVWCMAGANSAQAGAAYALSRPHPVNKNDPVLVHCNSHADGYWTDITRTYCLGEPDRQLRGIYDAVFSARAAALSQIKCGITASDVDRAAREVLRSRGLESAFSHSTGHGVGFTGIDANALPRLHPTSPDVLQAGMVFNVEPAVYLENIGGVRHCDMVAVTEQGYELLTPFQTNMAELVIPVPETQAA